MATTSITVSREVASDLRAVKVEMSRGRPREMTLSETLEALIASWRERRREEAWRV